MGLLRSDSNFWLLFIPEGTAVPQTPDELPINPIDPHGTPNDISLGFDTEELADLLGGYVLGYWELGATYQDSEDAYDRGYPEEFGDTRQAPPIIETERSIDFLVLDRDNGDLSNARFIWSNYADQFVSTTGVPSPQLFENKFSVYGSPQDDDFEVDTAEVTFGFDGDDSIVATGVSSIVGGHGDDTIEGSGASLILGQAGDDLLSLANDSRTTTTGYVDGGAGNDTILAFGETTAAYGGAGEDALRIGNGTTVHGDEGGSTRFADEYFLTMQRAPEVEGPVARIQDFDSLQDQLVLVVEDGRFVEDLQIAQGILTVDFSDGSTETMQVLGASDDDLARIEVVVS